MFENPGLQAAVQTAVRTYRKITSSTVQSLITSLVKAKQIIEITKQRLGLNVLTVSLVYLTNDFSIK